MAPPKKARTAKGFVLPRSCIYNLRSRMTRLRSGMRNNDRQGNNANRGRTTQPKSRASSRRAYRNSSTSLGGSSSSDSVKCAICLDTERCRAMEYIPCGHGFHTKCCQRWLARSGACPVCRTPVVTVSNTTQPQQNHQTPAFSPRRVHQRRRRRHVLIRQRYRDMFLSSASIIIIDVYRFRQPLSR